MFYFADVLIRIVRNLQEKVLTEKKPQVEDTLANNLHWYIHATLQLAQSCSKPSATNAHPA